MRHAALDAGQADVSQTRSASLRTDVKDVVTRFDHDLVDLFFTTILCTHDKLYLNLHCSYAAILTRLREGNETFSPLTMSVRLRCRRVTP
jgi:hypothetical protein